MVVFMIADLVHAEADEALQCSYHQVPPAIPDPAAQASLLQWRTDMPAMPSQGKRTCRYRDLPQDDEEPPAQEVFGDQVPLDEEGFKLVMDFPCGYEKELFVGRVAKEMGLLVKNDTRFHEWMPRVHKAHEDLSFDLAALRALIDQTSQETDSWLGKPVGKKRRPTSLMAFSEKVRPKKSVLLEQEENTDNTNALGNAAPLTEKGYRAVAKLKDDRQMNLFVKRAIASHNLRIVDGGALRGLVPYYSGNRAVQSLSALVEDFSKAQREPRPWLIAEVKRKAHDELRSEPGRHASYQKKRKGKEREGSFVQTASHSGSTSTSKWIHYFSVVIQEQTVYLLGARITAVACIGSLLFGLFLFHESNQQARSERLGEMYTSETSMAPQQPPKSVFGEPVK
jgi:hypothetical protein